VEERSEVKILLSAVFLCLAILSHYSAIFVTASFVTYQLVRLRMTRAPRKLFATWAVCQGAVAAVYLFLYFTQLKSLRGSAMEDRAVTTWLRLGYFEHGRENPVWFVVRQAKELFLYFFGSSYLAAVSIVLTVAGLIVFGRRRHPAVLLFALPFVLGAAAGLLGAYPFSGTRHSAYLIPAVAVPMAVAVSALFETRRRASLLVLAALVPLCWSSPVWSTSAHSLSDMNDAVAYIRGRAAPGSLLFSDHRTGSVLSYYLGRDARNTERAGLEDFRERYTGGYCLVDSPVWAPDPKAFGDELERMIRVYRLPPGQRLRVARLGFEYDSARVLSSRFPDAIFPDSRNFGELSIVEIWLGDGSEEREPQGKGRGLAGAGQ
jgi:hypothetical protein